MKLLTLYKFIPQLNAYDNLTKMVNINIQKVFSKLDDLQVKHIACNESRAFLCKRGENVITRWKPCSKFQFQDETTDKEYYDEMTVNKEVNLGLQYGKEEPCFRKTTFDEE